MSDTSTLEQAIIASARSIVQRQVTFKTGTVSSVTSSQILANVAIDGDSLMTDDNGQDQIPVTGVVPSKIVIGTGISVGDRVMVMFVPPSGAYVIGRYTGDYNPWLIIGTGSPAPPFAANWGNAAGTGIPGQPGVWSPTSFRRTGRFVELRGRAARSAAGGANPETMFTMAAQFCPTNDIVLTSINGPIAGLGYVIVRSTGEVQSFNIGNEYFLPNGYVCLDGMIFSIDVRS